MISDFIVLEEMEGSENRTVYMCSLPDPNLEHEDGMIFCGYVQRWWDPDMEGINIELLDNFKALCAGDTYQRKHFVSAVLDILEWSAGHSLKDAEILLHDFLGEFVGLVQDLD